MNAFLTRFLVRLYQEFDGDVLEAVVLGELGLESVSATAFAIAHTTGVPRETVRRKLGTLEQRGWITRSADGSYRVTPSAHLHFATWSAELRTQLLELASRLGATKA